MFVYIISEESQLTSDSLRKNNNLEEIIKLKENYKIPLIILLTHFDDYCKKVIKTEENWKSTCKIHLDKNKKELIEYIKKIIGEPKESSSKSDEIKMMHIVFEQEQIKDEEQEQIKDEEVIQKLSKEQLEVYEKEKDDEKKKDLLEFFKEGMDLDLKEDEVREFLEEEDMKNVLSTKDLIKKMRENLPTQYHNALKEIE